jgi:hypothetical protein
MTFDLNISMTSTSKTTTIQKNLFLSLDITRFTCATNSMTKGGRKREMMGSEALSFHGPVGKERHDGLRGD